MNKIADAKNAQTREHWADITRRVHALPETEQAAFARKFTVWVQSTSHEQSAPINLGELCFAGAATLHELEPPAPPTRTKPQC